MGLGGTGERAPLVPAGVWVIGERAPSSSSSSSSEPPNEAISKPSSSWASWRGRVSLEKRGKRENIYTYLVAHGESPVVGCWAPQVGYVCDIDEVD